MIKSRTLTFATLVLLGASCAQKKLNERDVKRNQEVAQAEAQRNEYQAVAGVYAGELIGSGDYRQKVVLNMRVQDVPIDNEGQVDPTLTPKLTGNLRILIGSEENGEFSDAAIQSAEYFASRKQLNVVVKNAMFNEMILNLSFSDPVLSGNWSASSVGVSGTTTLTKRP